MDKKEIVKRLREKHNKMDDVDEDSKFDLGFDRGYKLAITRLEEIFFTEDEIDTEE